MTVETTAETTAAQAAERRHERIEHGLHELFEVSLLAKALFATTELMTGIGLWLIKASWVVAAAQWLTRQEIAEDPTDGMAAWLLHEAHAFSIQTQHFWSIYLIGHGVIKLAVVVGLVLGIGWAYPASIVVLVGFIAYQMDQFCYTQALWMAALTVFDLVVIWLIWHEYQQLKKAGKV